ncbi:T-complex protein 1 subunit alpha-like [Dioscorea cayenensis subsp. rotundata]|uniref:T-complex protein 1 subunit alpha-like n=1 Tax=Dioscorea cayennensis subsp. rotundata TaxID=55577 RepID=A0AB40CBG7_DIOCR|nr:T-complex protein 1 subunit alpha-like [Dioscorea cayenensis subsp. rotundata]
MEEVKSRDEKGKRKGKEEGDIVADSNGGDQGGKVEKEDVVVDPSSGSGWRGTEVHGVAHFFNNQLVVQQMDPTILEFNNGPKFELNRVNGANYFEKGLNSDFDSSNSDSDFIESDYDLEDDDDQVFEVNVDLDISSSRRFLEFNQETDMENPILAVGLVFDDKGTLKETTLGDDIGDVTITNDGATILKMLEVEHPAAKVLVELAELQDKEVGDGTTSVVIISSELLKRANDLVRNKIHPTSIISGYRLAMREACKYVDEKLAVNVEKLGKDSLINCAKTSMSSKLIASDNDFFSNLVVDVVQAVKTTNARGEVKYPIKGINILKAHGKSARDSFLLNGYALNTGRAAQGIPTRVAPAKIACLDFNLQKIKMQMGVQLLVSDPRELEKIRQRESDITKERIEKLLKAGANVVLTTKGIYDMSLKYFGEAGAIAVRRVRKEDLRHVAKTTGATVVSTFADMEGEPRESLKTKKKERKKVEPERKQRRGRRKEDLQRSQRRERRS